MDIFIDISLLIWLLFTLFLLLLSFGFIEDEDWGKGWKITLFLVFLIPLTFILNTYLGNETVVGTVSEVNKTRSDIQVTSEISPDPKVVVESTQGILKAYQVAVYFEEGKKLKIFNNNNSLWRFKFNKGEIQLQLEKGRKYKFRLHKLFIQKNILDIEEL